MPRTSESLISKMLKFADDATLDQLDAAIEILKFQQSKYKGESVPRKTRKKRGTTATTPDTNES